MYSGLNIALMSVRLTRYALPCRARIPILVIKDPKTPAPYQVIALLEIESMDVLHEMLEQHGAAIMGDIPKFTDVEPIVQVSENLG